MKKFEFRLERVLEWRNTKLEKEREKQRTLLAELESIEAAVRQCEVELRAPYEAVMTGRELAVRQSYRDRLERMLEMLAQKRVDCQRRIAAQNAEVVKANRDVRLIEMLKEKALERWHAAMDREIEELASEAFLAQWARKMSRNV